MNGSAMFGFKSMELREAVAFQNLVDAVEPVGGAILPNRARRPCSSLSCAYSTSCACDCGPRASRIFQLQSWIIRITESQPTMRIFSLRDMIPNLEEEGSRMGGWKIKFQSMNNIPSGK